MGAQATSFYALDTLGAASFGGERFKKGQKIFKRVALSSEGTALMIFCCDAGSAPIAAAALPFAQCWTLASGRARVFFRLIYSMMHSPLLGMLNPNGY
jgi:hypothetical protein